MFVSQCVWFLLDNSITVRAKERFESRYQEERQGRFFNRLHIVIHYLSSISSSKGSVSKWTAFKKCAPFWLHTGVISHWRKQRMRKSRQNAEAALMTIVGDTE
jgi:hypothetical protein